jgi:hypothetical protein
MALGMTQLKTKLQSGFAKHNTTGLDAGKIIKEAVQKYISNAMDPAGGNFAGMPKLQTLDLELGRIFQKQSPIGALIGQKVAQKIDGAFMTLQCARQLSIVTTGGLPIFMTKVGKIFMKTPASGSDFGSDIADAINNYTTQIVITAMIPGSPPVVVTGPPA